jgi:hypothetical protein
MAGTSTLAQTRQAADAFAGPHAVRGRTRDRLLVGP